MKASGTNGKTGDTFKQRPALFGNELKPINPEEVSIWGGSTLSKLSTCIMVLQILVLVFL